MRLLHLAYPAEVVAVNRPGPLLRTCVVVCSALLIAGFVAYRAGALDWATGAESRPAETANPAATSSTDAGTPDPTAADVNAATKVYLSSSKSIAPLIPPTNAVPPKTPAAPPQQQQSAPPR
jgi:hypothetical protein